MDIHLHPIEIQTENIEVLRENIEVLRERQISTCWCSLVGKMIIKYDRQNRINTKKYQFQSIHRQLMMDLHYLNSTRHPGYMIFFLGKDYFRNDEEIKEIISYWEKIDILKS